MHLQSLDESASIILSTSFGSLSGIAAKYGLHGSERLLEQSTVKEISSAILKELCEQEEEEEGLALQRNREAREVRMPRDDAHASCLYPSESQS